MAADQFDRSSVPHDDPSRRFWFSVLNMFPFIFLPLVALAGLIAALVMPYLTGVYDH